MDGELRRLERLASQGDRQAEDRWFAAKCRAPDPPPVRYFVRYQVHEQGFHPSGAGFTWFAKIGERYTRVDSIYRAYPFTEDELEQAIQRAGSNMSGEVLMAGSAVAPYGPLTRVWPRPDLIASIGSIPI